MDEKLVHDKKVTELLAAVTSRSKKKYEEQLEIVKTKRIVGGKEDWNVFDSGIAEMFAEKSNWTTFHGIGGFTTSSFKDEMTQVRNDLHAAGKKMLVVDHFGQGGVGIEIGADKIITSSLAHFSGAPPLVEQVVGDGLSDKKTNEMTNKVKAAKAEGYALPLVIFRPVGGLSRNSLNLYAFRQLYAQLRTAYELLDDGGIILIGSFGSGVELQLVRDMLEKTGCSDLLMDHSNADAIGLKKKSGRAALPSEEEWARADATLVRRLLSLDTLDALNRAG